MRTYYHVTTLKNLKRIRQEGLSREHRRNVPLSKKGVVYVMSELLDAGYFASQMAWKMEEPVVILHLKLDERKMRQDLNPMATIGVWWEYHGSIPPSAITKVSAYDSRFKQAHLRRMAKAFGRR